MGLPRCLTLFCFALAGPWTLSGAEEADLAFFRDLAETRNFTLGHPVSPKITPDGKTVIFLRGGARDPVLRLYEHDIAGGTERELLTPDQLLGGAEEKLSAEEKARRERTRTSLKGFTRFDLSEDGSRLLVVLSGKLYVVERTNLKVSELPGDNWIDPRFSPDGRHVAAARDRELHTIDLSTNTTRRLTSGSSETLSHGTAEFIAQEEMGRHEGFWWSPDSQWLAYQQTDESGVEPRYIADPLHPEQPPTKFFYPRAGTANARVRVGVISRLGGETRWIDWDEAKYPYLARVVWKEKAAPLTLLVQTRNQQEQRLLAFDHLTGKTRELLQEVDSAWLDLDDRGAPPLWFKDGSHFLWTTERSGEWQIELRNAEGRWLRTLTPPAWRYAKLVGLDETGGSVLAEGHWDARETHLWSFSLRGTDNRQLSEGPGQHQAVFSPEAGLFVHTRALVDRTHHVRVVSSSDLRSRSDLRSVAESYRGATHTRTLRLPGDPSLDAAVTLPDALAGKNGASAPQKYPVILYVYAGPTVQRAIVSGTSYLLDQWMANRGYIVVRIDNRGTPGRGREWMRVIRGNFIDIALHDQIDGLRALAKEYPAMDLGRVGVTGWSFGGYFSAMATLRHPEIFKCGVAGAPVVTWENYDTHYTERYLGLPQENPEAYRVSNVTTYAAQLQRPLMLIHGITDDNVYFQHTLQLADALYRAGKPYDLLPMLGTHMISDPHIRLRQQMRIMEFFDRHLKNTDERSER